MTEGDTAVIDTEIARKELRNYAEELEYRFTPGGHFDTYCITTGERFVELVCGGIINDENPSPLCHCFDPLTAVQIFKDTIERYINGRKSGTIYWHTLPDLNWSIREYVYPREQGGNEKRVVYSIYARLLIK